MDFKDYIFLERKDRETIEKISTIAKNILNELETYYSGFFSLYFPDEHEKFIDWRSDCRRYEQNVPVFNSRRFLITSGTRDDLNGEYLDDRIYLYDKEFSNLFQELNNLHHNFEYNLRGNLQITSKNQKIKKEAKIINEKMMQRFKSKKEDYLKTLFHEIVHLFDHDKLGNKFNIITQNNEKELNRKVKYNQFTDPFLLPKNREIYNKIYTNSDIETNAWFLTTAHETLIKRFNNFQDLVNDFISSFKTHWSYLSENKKKKMINRLFKIYQNS